MSMNKSKNKNYGEIKGAVEWKKMLNEIRIQRFRTGKNDTLLSYKRLTLAASRSPDIKKILMESEIKDDK